MNWPLFRNRPSNYGVIYIGKRPFRRPLMLDDMHKRKIDMADEIYVINVGGYIGESTRSEIEYAKNIGRGVL